MYSTITFSKDGKPFNYVEFLCDNESDIGSLPTGFSVGSKAIVLEQNSVYILNGNKRWVLFNSVSSSSLSEIATKEDVEMYLNI